MRDGGGAPPAERLPFSANPPPSDPSGDADTPGPPLNTDVFSGGSEGKFRGTLAGGNQRRTTHQELGGTFASTCGGGYVCSESEATGSPSIRPDSDDTPGSHLDSVVEPNVRDLWRLLFAGSVEGDSGARMPRAPPTVAATTAPMKTPTEPPLGIQSTPLTQFPQSESTAKRTNARSGRPRLWSSPWLHAPWRL